MTNKTRAMADMAGSQYIPVTRAHARGCTPLSFPAAISAMGEFPVAFDRWLAERCVVAFDTVTPTMALFADWQEWAQQQQTRVGSVKRFSLAIGAKGFEQVQTRNWRGYGCIALKHTVTAEREIASPQQEADPQKRKANIILALDLGTSTGFALGHADGRITSGTASFRPSRYDGGGMRYLRFANWLDVIAAQSGPLAAVHFEEVRRHVGTDAAHVFGGFLATLTSWCEQHGIAYQGVPVGTVKRFIAGRGNADKAAVVAAVKARGFSPADDNEADAIAILLWAIDTRGGVR